MSDKYKIFDEHAPYFLTFTIVEWIGVFSRHNQKLAFIDSLKFCQKNKGLSIFAYVIMPNHIHLICRADGNIGLTEILRDLKTYTSKNIIRLIKDEPESRREWMLNEFSKACKHLKREQKYKVWQNGNHAKIIYTTKFLYEKLNYIHQNPVKEMIVSYPEDYLFSSARNYAGLESVLDVEVLEAKPLT